MFKKALLYFSVVQKIKIYLWIYVGHLTWGSGKEIIYDFE